MSIRKGNSKSNKKSFSSNSKSQRRISRTANTLNHEIDSLERNIVAIQADTPMIERAKIYDDVYALQRKAIGKSSDRIFLLSEKLKHETPVPLWITDNYNVSENYLELLRMGNVEIDYSYTPKDGGELYLPYVTAVNKINSIKKNMNGLNSKKIIPTDSSSSDAINIYPDDLEVGMMYEFLGGYNNKNRRTYKLVVDKNIDGHGRTVLTFLGVGSNKYDAMDILKQTNKNQQLIDVNREIEALKRDKKQLSNRTKRFKTTKLYRTGGGLATLAFVGTPTQINDKLKKLTIKKKQLLSK